jgi:hypothetical protein
VTRARILVNARDYQPLEDSRAVWSPVRFTVSYGGKADFSGVATVRQLGMRFNFRDLQITEPANVPEAVDRHAIWTAVRGYYSDSVHNAALANEGSVRASCEVRDRVA